MHQTVLSYQRLLQLQLGGPHLKYPNAGQRDDLAGHLGQVKRPAARMEIVEACL